MKKIMMVLAAVALAASAQASAFSWKTSATGKIYEAGSTTALLSSGTAYIFDAGVYSQTAMIEAFAAGTLNLGQKSISETTGTISAGAIAGTALEYGSDGDRNDYYVAILSGEDLFVSDSVAVTGAQGKTTTISFSLKAASQLAAMDASNGYTKGGWYQAVPEPTSGLLLLLGMAGLALKRKQA